MQIVYLDCTCCHIGFWTTYNTPLLNMIPHWHVLSAWDLPVSYIVSSNPPRKRGNKLDVLSDISEFSELSSIEKKSSSIAHSTDTYWLALAHDSLQPSADYRF